MRLARFALVALVLAAPAAGPAAGIARAGGAPVPVIVELFTAEGCSACPPADALLERLAKEQPVSGAEIVALELHVDYFDSPGSADPFAQAGFGARQADYQRAFGKKGWYTPQMVVDGQRELVGSREREARDAVADTSRAPKAKVQVARAGDRLTITLEGLSDVTGSDGADLMLAITEDGLGSRSLGGGHGGAHGPVVRDLRKLTTFAGERGTVQLKDVELKLDGAWRRENLRAVAFVQRTKTLEILGAGSVGLP